VKEGGVVELRREEKKKEIKPIEILPAKLVAQ
jgi:hypothetical protein